MPIITVPDSNKLFEGVVVSNNNIHNNQGFSYGVRPLSNNLAKGNDDKCKLNNNTFKFFVGEMVSGISLYDNRKHTGIITYIYWETTNGKLPSIVYIMDLDSNKPLPLDPSTLKHKVNSTEKQIINKYASVRGQHVIESVAFDFNRALKENKN